MKFNRDDVHVWLASLDISSQLLGELGGTLSADEIASWKLKGAPIVFNNSCSSWPTTGRAFLAAGAAGYIGTLWPVSSCWAADVAAEIGKQVHDSDSPDLGAILSSAQRAVIAGKGLSAEAGVYVYVGLPGLAFLNELPINKAESLQVTSGLITSAYETLDQIVTELRRPDLAAAIHSALVSSLQRRMQSFIVAGELPTPFPPFPGTVIDFRYFLSLCDYEFGASLLTQLAHEHQGPVIQKMDDFLLTALKELVEWDERHDTHMGRSPEIRAKLSEQFGMPIGHDGGDLGFYRRSASYVLRYTLPFANILCENRKYDRAQFWFDLSAKLATLREDLSPDGSVSDTALIRRIREGVLVEHRVLWARTLGEKTTKIDILAASVSKSELANRFGIVLKRLNRNERAIPFFEAARALADPAGEEFANATSNLASVMSGDRRQHRTYLEALKTQIACKDFRNAIVTTANILRGMEYRPHNGESLLNRALGWLPLLGTETARAHARSDLLGAAAIYFASRNLHGKVASSLSEIAALLARQPSEKSLAVHLNEVLEYYVRLASYELAAVRALDNGQLLEQTGLPDVALKTYSIAADCALRASGGRRKRFLSLFFDSSKRIARLVSKHPNAEGNAPPAVTLTRDNTQSLWWQLSERGDRRMALEAYEALKVWPPRTNLPEWEDLGYALHPKNDGVVKVLCTAGLLRRDAMIEIVGEQGARVTVTTVRGEKPGQTSISIGSVPDQVFMYWPLRRKSSTTLPRGSKPVARTAVFRLGWAERAVVSETTQEGVRTDDKGTFVYEEVWGSKTIPYSVTLTCARGMVPTHFDFRTIDGPRPSATVAFVGGRISMLFRSTDAARPCWLGTLLAVMRTNSDLLAGLGDVCGTLGEPVSYDLYKAVSRLLAPSIVSGLAIFKPRKYPSMGVVERRALECVLRRVAEPESFTLTKDSCREILLQVVIVVHEDALLWPDEDYGVTLSTISPEAYRKQIVSSSQIVRPFGQALFARPEFKRAVQEQEDLVNLFIHAVSRLVHEVLPEKNLPMQMMAEVILPFARSVMILRPPEE